MPTLMILPLSMRHQSLSGIVEVQLSPGKKLEHMGIKIELVGTIGDGHLMRHLGIICL